MDMIERLEAEIAKGEAALEAKRAKLKKKRAERRSTERGRERKLRNRRCIIVGAVVLGRLVDVEPADALRRRVVAMLQGALTPRDRPVMAAVLPELERTPVGTSDGDSATSSSAKEPAA